MNEQSLFQVSSAVCPWLMLLLSCEWLAGRCGLRVRGWRLLLLSGAVATVVMLLPVAGAAIARRVAGISANFSVPFTCMLAVAAWQLAFARRVISERDWTTAWTFGASGGLALYPMALGLGSVDPYEWGWEFSPLFVVVGALTVWLIWARSTFAVALLLAALAFHLGVLESTNYWDYLLDPIYFLASIIALARRLTAPGRGEAPLAREVP
jgi:hypothetical protein